MSRIGRNPIPVPTGVKVDLKDGLVKVEGPKGKLELSPHPSMAVEFKDGSVVVQRPDDGRKAKSLHGLTRTLIRNMILGVSEGYVRDLLITGVGYRAEAKGKSLTLSLGYSHQINYPLPAGVTAAVDDRKTKITLKGIDKQLLGSTAAKIRSFRPPEPYGGKGIRYADEVILRKEGKSGAK